MLAILALLAGHVSSATEYVVAHTPAPVLNSPDFSKVFGGSDGRKLKTDRCGQIRELEYIAMKGSIFRVVNKLHTERGEVYQVESDEYTPSPNNRLYVDRRFVEVNDGSARRKLLLPEQAEIAAALRASVGGSYIWGGNVAGGVPELSAWFFTGIRPEEAKNFTLAGLDCSGLLYHATGGWTPRNTAQLINYGQSVAIAGLQAAEITALLRPLDLIVWNGHVIIVLDKFTAIESRLECGRTGNGGVVMTPLQKRVAEVMRTRRPVNVWQSRNKVQDVFVVRRWHVQP